MEISTERAFWILEFYRRCETALHVGGKILGEEAGCTAKVTYVWPLAHSIVVRLLPDQGGRGLDILIPLKGASFCFDQLGNDSFDSVDWAPSHSVLRAGFADGTVLIFAELMST